jgi:hypothetical protein
MIQKFKLFRFSGPVFVKLNEIIVVKFFEI